MTRPPDAIAGRFDPIGLAEAEERAPFAIRTDRKYVLDPATFAQLAERLVDDHLALDVGGRRLSSYDTIYFDTPELLSFRQHVQGRRRRFKCRTRLYGGGGPCFVEVKLKGPRGETLKRRLEVPVPGHGELAEASLGFLASELLRAYGHGTPADLGTTLGTSFTRLTLVAREARERVTCDFGLAFRSGAARHEIAPGRVVVETKTALGNGVADRHLRRLGVRPVTPCSKYCVGVALTRADVRDNAFRRLVRRHFVAPADALAVEAT